MIRWLKLILIVVWFWMVYVVVSTSLESSLFKEWDFLVSIPWMRATLWDFYGNVLIIYLWVLYRERTLGMRIMWLVLFFCLGSIATILYAFIQLSMLNEGEPFQQIFKPKVEVS